MNILNFSVIISLALITSMSFILTGCSGSSNPSENIISQGITVDNTIGSNPTEAKSNALTGNLASVVTSRSVPKSVTPTPFPTVVPEPVDEDDSDEDYESEEEYISDTENDYTSDLEPVYDYDYDDDDYDYDDYEEDYDSDYVETMVWIPRTGHKYHSYEGCSNMKNPSYVTLDEAIDRGYTQCSKCW